MGKPKTLHFSQEIDISDADITYRGFHFNVYFDHLNAKTQWRLDTVAFTLGESIEIGIGDNANNDIIICLNLKQAKALLKQLQDVLKDK